MVISHSITRTSMGKEKGRKDRLFAGHYRCFCGRQRREGKKGKEGTDFRRSRGPAARIPWEERISAALILSHQTEEGKPMTRRVPQAYQRKGPSEKRRVRTYWIPLPRRARGKGEEEKEGRGERSSSPSNFPPLSELKVRSASISNMARNLAGRREKKTVPLIFGTGIESTVQRGLRRQPIFPKEEKRGKKKGGKFPHPLLPPAVEGERAGIYHL